MKKVIIGIVGIAVVGLIGIRIATRGNEAPPRSIEEIQAEEGVPVDVATVRTDTITLERRIVGRASGARQSTLRASGPQKVADILVREGDRIRRGDPILRYDTTVAPDRAARLAQAKEAYDNAKRQVDRLEPLFTEGAIAESELDAARTQLAIARADLRDAELELEVVSPIDGTITFIPVRRGDAVEAGDVVAQVAVLDSLRVEADVSGGTAREIARGAEVLVDPGSAPAARRGGSSGSEPGRITRVALGADPDTKLSRVEAIVGNRGGSLRPGDMVALDVVVARVGPVLVMPIDAVLSDETILPESRQEVYAVVDGTARRTAIEVGQVSTDLVEVRSGLQEGAQVVVFGANLLGEGRKVRLHRIDGVLTAGSADSLEGKAPAGQAVDEAASTEKEDPR